MVKGKNIILGILIAGMLTPLAAFAARTNDVWVYPNSASYLQPNFGSAGLDLFLIGSNHYINFGSVTGTNGYGFRDNAGTMEFKNSGGSWTGVGTGGGGGSGVGTSTEPFMAKYFVATSTLISSQLPYASTTALSAGTLCLTGDICRTTWPTGGSGSFPFTTTGYGVSTTTIVGFTNGLMSLGSTTITGPLTVSSLTATSTFFGPVRISVDATTKFPALFVGTSTGGCPLYGCLPGDLLATELDWNGVTSVEAANANSGSCAGSAFWTDGNIPGLGSDFGALLFTNTGWVGGAACGVGNGLERPESTALVEPTGDITLEIGSSSASTANPVGVKIYTKNTNLSAIFTNNGTFGIGSSTPDSILTVSNTAQTTGKPQLFSVASTSGGTATTTLFSIDNVGNTVMTLAASSSFKVGNVSTSSNPTSAFMVLASTTNAENGLTLTTSRSGNGVILSTNSWASTEALTIQSKGAGTLTLSNPAGNIAPSLVLGTNAATINFSGTPVLTMNNSIFQWIPTALISSAPEFLMRSLGGSGMTASTEVPVTQFSFSGLTPVTFSHTLNTDNATGIALQREFLTTAGTETFAASTTAGNAVRTITDNATFGIDSPPRVGTNGRQTNAYGMLIGSSTATTMFNASTTNSYGIGVWTSAGAANTYAATFNGGNVGIGTTSPVTTLAVTGNGLLTGGFSVGQGAVQSTAGVIFSQNGSPSVYSVKIDPVNSALTYTANANAVAALSYTGSNSAFLNLLTGGANTVRLDTVGVSYFNGGTVAVGTTTSVADFVATNRAANSTSTIELGKSTQNKGTCVKMYDETGAAAYLYVKNGGGVPTLSVSTTACASVTGF